MYSSLSFSWYSRGCFQNGARRLQGQIWSNKATVGCARAGVSLPGWKKRGSGHEQGKRTRLCEVNKLLDTIHYTHIGSPTSVTLSVLRFISCSYNILVFPHRSLRCTLAVYVLFPLIVLKFVLPLSSLSVHVIMPEHTGSGVRKRESDLCWTQRLTYIYTNNNCESWTDQIEKRFCVCVYLLTLFCFHMLHCLCLHYLNQYK